MKTLLLAAVLLLQSRDAEMLKKAEERATLQAWKTCTEIGNLDQVEYGYRDAIVKNCLYGFYSGRHFGLEEA